MHAQVTQCTGIGYLQGIFTQYDGIDRTDGNAHAAVVAFIIENLDHAFDLSLHRI